MRSSRSFGVPSSVGRRCRLRRIGRSRQGADFAAVLLASAQPLGVASRHRSAKELSLMRIPDTLLSLADYGIIDEVLRPLMSGKEAQVYLVVSSGHLRV